VDSSVKMCKNFINTTSPQALPRYFCWLHAIITSSFSLKITKASTGIDLCSITRAEDADQFARTGVEAFAQTRRTARQVYNIRNTTRMRYDERNGEDEYSIYQFAMMLLCCALPAFDRPKCRARFRSFRCLVDMQPVTRSVVLTPRVLFLEHPVHFGLGVAASCPP
jgi:hypothetical protein